MLPFDTKDLKYSNNNDKFNRNLLDRKFPDYIRRLLDFKQMDFEAAFDQLLTLISLEPQQM